VQADAGERQIAVDLLTTNETYFFREPKHFDFLRSHALPELKGQSTVRVWSGACSSGEEPYTIAMVMAEVLGGARGDRRVGHLHPRAGPRAGGALPDGRRGGHSRPLLAKYCLKGIGSQDGTFMMKPELSGRIHFRQINLNATLPDIGQFDVIFLRNVMIYFDLETKRQVIRRILPLLRPGAISCSAIRKPQRRLRCAEDRPTVDLPQAGLNPCACLTGRRDLPAAGRVVFRRPAHAYPHRAWFLCVCGVLAPDRLIGGMCHFVLPSRGRSHSRGLDGRYGDEAFDLMLREIRAARTRPEDYRVAFWRWQHVSRPGRRARHPLIGQKNVVLAHELVRTHCLRCVGAHVEGHGHRHLLFDIWSGRITMKHAAGRPA
jgi:chemotaxis receptor (MCP) glutamine deamidase CheD